MIYGTYVKQYNQILDKIYHIIYDGGNERDSMKILINSKSKLIYSSEKYNLFDSEQIFQEIKYYLEEEKGLVTLARDFDGNQKELHSYSVIGAWNFCQGKAKKKVLCIKNPWIYGDNDKENFNLNSLNNSLKNFPELIDFNNRFFYPSENIQTYNQYDYLVKNDSKNGISSVFIAPLDYLINNVLYEIEAHVPNYNKDFPNVNLELELYKKLDKLFSKIQANNTKNVFDSRVEGISTVTRVISIGDKNTREIISDIYNKSLFRITKNGKSYCQIERKPNGEYNINDTSKLFQNDYLDNNYILVNNITGEKNIISIDALINSGFKGNGNYDLITMQHNLTLMPQTGGDFRNLINNSKNIQNRQNNLNKTKQNILLVDKIQPRIFKNFRI